MCTPTWPITTYDYSIRVFCCFINMVRGIHVYNKKSLLIRSMIYQFKEWFTITNASIIFTLNDLLIISYVAALYFKF